MARKKTAKAALATRANADASTDMSERGRGSKKANELNPAALHLLRAADEGEREGHISGMAECAAMARDTYHPSTIAAPDLKAAANVISHTIVAELCRRYGADNPRVIHHLELRGLT